MAGRGGCAGAGPPGAAGTASAVGGWGLWARRQSRGGESALPTPPQWWRRAQAGAGVE